MVEACRAGRGLGIQTPTAVAGSRVKPGMTFPTPIHRHARLDRASRTRPSQLDPNHVREDVAYPSTAMPDLIGYPDSGRRSWIPGQARGDVSYLSTVMPDLIGHPGSDCRSWPPGQARDDVSYLSTAMPDLIGHPDANPCSGIPGEAGTTCPTATAPKHCHHRDSHRWTWRKRRCRCRSSSPASHPAGSTGCAPHESA